MRETDAPSTGSFVTELYGVCRPTGDSHTCTPRGPAQRRGRKAKAAPAVIGESSAASSEEVRVRNQVGKESARPRALLYVVPKVCASATWPFMKASPHPDKPGIPKSGCSYRWAKRRAALKRGPQSTARDSIKAGAPAFGCTVHPLRLQAPRAAYAHKSPGQGDCTATPGWPGGRDGRKSINQE